MTIESQMIVIFGGTGDLTRRKLIPSLYHLIRREKVNRCTPIVCIGRRDLTQEQFIQSLQIEKYIDNPDREIIEELVQKIVFLRFDSNHQSAEEFQDLIRKIETRHGCSTNKLIYLALPTGAFSKTAELIGKLKDENGWQRVVFEKPFGADTASARKLNEHITTVLEEEEIYRVDHYLGKELVRNILTLRFGNEIFETAWGCHAVEQVQITVAESLGVEKRAGYYDTSGAVRDMVQNHLLQLLSFVAMEPPADGSPDALRDEAVRVLKNLRPVTQNDVVLGQYGEGSIKGEKVCAYRQEEGVQNNSETETYAALRAYVETPRWKGVPFYVRTGKRLHKRYAEIRIVLKQHSVLGKLWGSEANVIVIRIQPDEGIGLTFNVRKPGERGETSSVLMDFCHHCHFGPNSPEAYESILFTVMQGDHAIFPRWDWIDESWKFVDNLYLVVKKPAIYKAGSEGPDAAARLLRADGREWLAEESIERVTPFASIR